MIMESSVRLGQQAKLESSFDRTANGYYIVQGIAHRGSMGLQSVTGQCTTTLELQRIP
ncbi:hypothetical protein FACS1894152_1580 [Bacilli bacterium]|nr:hypothetical protein FACS1894152_1580 [Bacilli bacterium]